MKKVDLAEAVHRHKERTQRFVRTNRFGRMCLLLTTILSVSVASLWLTSEPVPMPVVSAIFLMVLAGLLIIGLRQRRFMEALADRLERTGGANPPSRKDEPVADRLTRHADALMSRVQAMEHRFAQCHGLTGLPTREPLIALLEQETETGLLGIVELGDFDRLCAFDITVADKVLVELASRLVRMTGPDRFVAHVDRARLAIWYGGTSAEAARAELNAVSYALRNRIVMPGVDMLPQIRSACVQHSPEAFNGATLLGRAIAALSAVEGGATEQDEGSAADYARESFSLEQDLRHAASRNELELWYQPFIDAGTQEICGAEALLRWHHPERGLVSPTTFIPIMETAGLAQEIGMWTLNAGCRQAKAWSRDGHTPLKIAINLSGHQLERSDIDQMVERTLQRHHLSPSLLELELTETVAAVDSVNAKSLFDKLRALGVSVSIDDFGAGYSSLSYLKKLRFDKLKIDREFVSMVDRQRDSQAICQSIIALARGLGIALLAEGVERPEEYAWLHRHGCTLFQGFYFSPPLEASAFERFAQDKDAIRMLTDLSPTALQERLRTSAL
ncbi:MAG: EAL domain-containing protein [Sphingobium sp.]|uniref:putative bifunctional diguanylate cyclase/phosphodiesterase n=1 Tax=Sphingobium sp. TaxID=1912891 RepID=UPI0029A02F88|nr:EAL domain-containing protein [Sphingobium sp.]MDX3909616.1 EAL domain-containing protein [Sphingobium sp.]